ncbi:MAG: hypothetical protein ACRD1R_15490 [Acidobacteriota bacterium]
MNIKDLIPSDLLVAVRLLKTKATLAGWLDLPERSQRISAVALLNRQHGLAGNGKRTLVFSFRGWYPHVAWDALLAHALRLRGAAVHVFNCGGRLPICEVNFRHASPALVCRECSAYPERLVRSLALPQSWLRDYVQEKELRQIQENLANLNPAEYESWSFNGVPIGSLVLDSVCWFVRKSRPQTTGEDAEVYRDFLRSGAQIALAAPRLLEAFQPDVVLELNGQFFAERIFNFHVPAKTAVIAYEAGWKSNTLGFDRVSGRGPIDLDAAWAELKDLPLTEEENLELDRWIQTRAAGDMQRDFYVRFKQDSGSDLVAQLRLRPDLPVAVLFTNVVWDTAVLGCELGFQSIREWLIQTVEYFRRRPRRQLVVRIHPAEDLRPSQEAVEKLADVLKQLEPLPNNIRIVPSDHPLSTYKLMDISQLALVYTSTAGIEMALRGKPVVVAARRYYCGRGFTIDVERGTDYSQLLDRALQIKKLDPNQVEVARRFAYLLLFRYLHKIPVVKQRPRKLPLLEPAEAGMLLPNASPELDQLLTAILQGRDFVRMPPH